MWMFILCCFFQTSMWACGRWDDLVLMVSGGRCTWWKSWVHPTRPAARPVGAIIHVHIDPKFFWIVNDAH
jgi:hypothetical protein